MHIDYKCISPIQKNIPGHLQIVFGAENTVKSHCQEMTNMRWKNLSLSSSAESCVLKVLVVVVVGLVRCVLQGAGRCEDKLLQ